MTDSGGMLVAAPERWDEACFAVPAVRAMAAAGLRIGVLCPAAQHDFWKSVGRIEVVEYPEKPKARKVAAAISGSWDASLAWEAGFAADVFQAARIPRRLGIADGRLKKRLTHPLGVSPGPLDHRVRLYLAAVRELGMDAGRAEYFEPADLGVVPQPGTVLLCPGSDFGPSHEWPLERWVEIAGKVAATGRRLTVASVDGGRELGRKLAEILGDGAEFFHAAPLAGALPLLAVHEHVIAADGSLPHLAAHAGATCVVLFGPNDPAWKRPLGKRHATVRRHVECAPCLLPKCPLDLRCQSELDPERVWAAISEKFS